MNLILKGGEFLIKETDIQTNFIPEDLNEDQLMIRNSVRTFVTNEVQPKGNEMANQVDLLLQAGELGLQKKKPMPTVQWKHHWKGQRL